MNTCIFRTLVLKSNSRCLSLFEKRSFPQNGFDTYTGRRSSTGAVASRKYPPAVFASFCALILALSSAQRLYQDVVFIIRKNGSVEGRTTMEAGPQAQGPPLTLLVDKGTASAAEVFAAAVR